MPYARELSRSAELDIDLCVVVSLEKRSRQGICNMTFDRLFDNGCLLFAPSHEANPLRRKDSRDAYRQCTRRQFLHAYIFCRFVTRGRVNQDKSCDRTDCRARLIHGYITFTANTEQGNIETSKILDYLLIVVAIFHKCTRLDGSIESHHIVGGNIYMRDKQFVDVLESRTRILLVERIVLVEIHYHHVLEAESVFVVTTDELIEQRSQGKASTKANHAVLKFLSSLVNKSLDLVGNLVNAIVGCLENLGRNLLEASERRAIDGIQRLVVSRRHFVERDLRTQIGP